MNASHPSRDRRISRRIQASLSGADPNARCVQDIARPASTEFSVGRHSVACSISVFRLPLTLTITATDATAASIDQVQQSYAMSPCRVAAVTGMTVEVDALDHETINSEFRRMMEAAGPTAVVALPLGLQPQFTAVLTLYADAVSSLTPTVIVQATDLLHQVREPLQYLIDDAMSKDQEHGPAEALSFRTITDRAVAVLGATRGLGTDEAVTWLIAESLRKQTSMRTIAAAVIASAT
jgi:hypothetical protein